MESLKQQALSFGEYPIKLSTGHGIEIPTWTIRFPKWSGVKLRDHLQALIEIKPLLNFMEDRCLVNWPF
jgi:hypothetical protein